MAKGVILCGGTGSRLRPATLVTNKHLIPIGSTPMILHPLSALKSMGVVDILIVTGGNHIGAFAEFLGDGSQYGVNLTYRVQTKAGGIAQALGLAEDFVGDDYVYVVLGDNVFGFFNDHVQIKRGSAAIFLTENVEDLRRFGVYRQNENAIIEKPNKVWEGDRAVTGFYIYPPEVFEVIKTLVPSERGELEITDVNNHFLLRDLLVTTDISKTFWSDCGTPESLANTTRWSLDNPKDSFLHVLGPKA